MIRRRLRLPGAVAVAATALSLSGFAGASSAATLAGTVSATPAPWTPYVVSADSNVNMITQCGPRMYAVGTFTRLSGPGQASVTRRNIFSFDATTGAISSWDPNVNGTVNSIALSPDCSSAYIGGKFTAVGATSVRNLAKISTTTGAVDHTFGDNANGQVSTLTLTGGHLLIGGYFSSINDTATGYVGSLNPASGKNDGYIRIPISGTFPNTTTHIYKFELSHSATRLLVSGAFTSVGGRTDMQIFMLDLGATSATLDPWYSRLFNGVCTASERFFVKGFNWSPDDSRIYIATTGYKGATLCDVAAAFSSSANSDQPPIWINKTGCDSLYATVADNANVYIGGHERWANNPSGCDNAGPGAVSRPGIGDIDPLTGTATAWNPTRSRGHGVDDLYLDPAGRLWVSSDNGDNSYTKCANKYHPGICMFPRY